MRYQVLVLSGNALSGNALPLSPLSLPLHSHTATQQEHTRLYLCVRVCMYFNPETRFCILAHQV